MNIRPLYDRIVVKRIEDDTEKTAGGLFIPDSAKEKPQQGEVVAVGQGKRNEDGVTVAKEVELKDPLENMGAQMVREVASKTSDVAGDGTTTATVLAQCIFREGVKSVAAGANPMALKRGIERAVEAVVEEVKKLSVKVTQDEKIAQI